MWWLACYRPTVEPTCFLAGISGMWRGVMLELLLGHPCTHVRLILGGSRGGGLFRLEPGIASRRNRSTLDSVLVVVVTEREQPLCDACRHGPDSRPISACTAAPSTSVHQGGRTQHLQTSRESAWQKISSRRCRIATSGCTQRGTLINSCSQASSLLS